MKSITRRGLLLGTSVLAVAGLGGARLRAADNIEILASLPNMAFPFFVHMMKAIHAEADKLGQITVDESDGQGSPPKQTADVETALLKGVKGIVISPNEGDAMEAVKARGLSGKVAIMGFDALPEARAVVRDGSLTATIEQFPGGQSSQAVDIRIDKVRNGKDPEKKLILLTPIAITKDNFNQAE